MLLRTSPMTWRGHVIGDVHSMLGRQMVDHGSTKSRPNIWSTKSAVDHWSTKCRPKVDQICGRPKCAGLLADHNRARTVDKMLAACAIHWTTKSWPNARGNCHHNYSKTTLATHGMHCTPPRWPPWQRFCWPQCKPMSTKHRAAIGRFGRPNMWSTKAAVDHWSTKSRPKVDQTFGRPRWPLLDDRNHSNLSC